VGGAFAFSHFTGIQRPTKDFDLFVRREHIERALDTLATAGFHSELTFPHWLGKARSDEFLVDLIFGSGNGVAPVDDGWFEHAVQAEAVGVPVLLCPAEELLWSKAFVMERERYDGADVIHILHTQRRRLDWTRLVDRFGGHWRILLLNLVLYGFVYPGEDSPAPPWVMGSLLARLNDEVTKPPTNERVCRGTLISRKSRTGLKRSESSPNCPGRSPVVRDRSTHRATRRLTWRTRWRGVCSRCGMKCRVLHRSPCSTCAPPRAERSRAPGR